MYIKVPPPHLFRGPQSVSKFRRGPPALTTPTVYFAWKWGGVSALAHSCIALGARCVAFGRLFGRPKMSVWGHAVCHRLKGRFRSPRSTQVLPYYVSMTEYHPSPERERRSGPNHQVGQPRGRTRGVTTPPVYEYHRHSPLFVCPACGGTPLATCALPSKARFT